MGQIWSLFFLAIILWGPVLLGLFVSLIRQQPAVSQPLTQVGLDALTLWTFVQVSLGLILGSLHQFAAGPVLIAELAMAIAGVMLFWACPQVRRKLKGQISGRKNFRLEPAEVMVIASAAFVALVLFERVATQPFTNYDTLWFHGPIIARWYQTASLSQLDPLGNWIIDHPYAQNYPHSWFVLSVFFLLPFQQDLLAAFPMLLAWLMLGLATFLLGISFGAKRFYALAGAALVLYAPILLNQVTTLHVDLPLAAIGIVSFYYLRAYQTSRCPTDKFFFLATAGLLLGIKTTSLIYTGVLVLVFGLLEARSFLQKPRPNAVLRSSFTWAGVLAFLFLGGFWYVTPGLRPDSLAIGPSTGGFSLANSETLLAATHSAGMALQPASLSSTIKDLWAYITFLQSETLTSYFNLANPAHWAVFTSQALARFQIPLVALMVQAIFMPYAWVKSSSRSQRHQIVLLSLAFGVTFFLYWNTPFSAFKMTPAVGLNMRYGFPAFALMGVVAAVSATALQTSKRLIAGVVMGSAILGVASSTAFDKVRIQALIGTSSFWPSQLASTLFKTPLESTQKILNLVSSIGLVDVGLYLALFTLLVLTLCTFKFWSPFLKAVLDSLHQKTSSGLVVVFCALMIVAASVHLQYVRDANRHQIYNGIYDVIESAVKPEESIAYLASTQNYLLYGKHLDKAVINLGEYVQDQAVWRVSIKQANASVIALDLNGLNGEDQSQVQRAMAETLGVENLPPPIFGKGLKRFPTLYRLIP